MNPIKLLKRPFCNHDNIQSEEYDVLVTATHSDSDGVYQPYFEGVKHECEDCGKKWRTDITPYRYYIDVNWNLVEKVQKEP